VTIYREEFTVQDTTNKYSAPAIERRESVTGLLGRQKGTYCPPK
jgi:hypothetical protein